MGIQPISKKSKIPPLNTKVGKYFLAVQRGVSKRQAAIDAGYSPTNRVIERTKPYQALEEHFKDYFLDKMGMGELAEFLVDNIRQDSEEKVDRHARNGAIKIALDRVEPEVHPDDDDAKVLIVLSN